MACLVILICVSSFIVAISFPDWGSYEESWLKLLQEIPLKKVVTEI